MQFDLEVVRAVVARTTTPLECLKLAAGTQVVHGQLLSPEEVVARAEAYHAFVLARTLAALAFDPEGVKAADAG